MVNIAEILVPAFFALFSVYYGYRMMTAVLVFRSLPSIDADGSPQIVGGEPVAIEGELIVEEAVETGDLAVDGVDSPVGAYVWRARYSDKSGPNGKFENLGWEKPAWNTFASGIEWGRFGIDAGDKTILVEPGWLREQYDSKLLGDLVAGGINKNDRLSVYLWESWYLFLRDHTSHLPLERFEGIVQRHNDRVHLDRYLFESRLLVEGMTVNIRGEGHIEQGESVIRGSDEIPLVISDQGFDAHRRRLTKQAIRKGAIATFVLFVPIGVWFGIDILLYVFEFLMFAYPLCYMVKYLVEYIRS